MFDHVVVLMLENHSFDRMLGYLQGVGDEVEGVDPADLRKNPDRFGASVAQHVTEARFVADDPGHDLADVLEQIGHRGSSDSMQGFVRNFAEKYPAKAAEWPEIMGYYPQGFLPALHTLAESFVVCDHWFSSVPGPTWPNRFFVHSGTSLGHVDMPEGLFSPGLHLYDQTTIFDLLHDAGKGFCVYYGDFPQSLVLLHDDERYLANYRNMSFFAQDLAAGRLANYTFIEPTYFASNGQNDQHPPHDVLRGDALIAEVYGALRAAPAIFEQTLLVILYDEHGGFYDHVEPPGTVAPDGNTAAFAFDRLGPRVPAVLVSPLLDPGVLTDVFDHTSLLRFLVDGWGLARGGLGARTSQAANFGTIVPVRSTPRFLPALPPIQPAPAVAQSELNANQASLVAFSHYLESRIENPALKAPLMARAHEVFAGPAAQAKLAQDRLAAFFQEKRGVPG